MHEVSRRKFLGRTAAAGGAALVVPALTGWAGGSAWAGTDAAGAGGAVAATDGLVTVLPGDAAYAALVAGANGRWTGTPDYVLLADTADEVVAAVQDTVDKGLRFAPRTGGHCYENFTSSAEIRVNVNTSAMKGVSYDPVMKAFAVEPGAQVGQVYQTLFDGWGVTIPAGTCPSVAMGGHIVGGGYGPLSRSLGVTVDYLHAVEVVVVDRNGRARKVVATRNPGDPNAHLWWAHTGAGGGNYGIITKYWLRAPGTEHLAPAAQLPRAPRELIVSEVVWSWQGMTERAFNRLLGNFTRWHQYNSAPGSIYNHLFSAIKPRHISAGEFIMSSQIDSAVPGADRLLDDYLAAVNEGTGLTYRVDARRRVDWLYNVLNWPGLGGSGFEGKGRFKAKSAYVRKALPDVQLKAMYRQLTGGDFDNPAGIVEIAGYGGRVNTVAPSATAVPQRDSVIKMLYLSLWATPAEDAKNLTWVRNWYRNVYATSGGVPSPYNGVNDGAFINYADADLADPAVNTSALPWHHLYFKDSYARLRVAKNLYDPRNLFRHPLSIRL